MPGLLADERNLDFPLEKVPHGRLELRFGQGGHFMQLLLGFLSQSRCAAEAQGLLEEEQFKAEDEEILGLRRHV